MKCYIYIKGADDKILPRFAKLKEVKKKGCSEGHRNV
mgnify:CR=1 FL=1